MGKKFMGLGGTDHFWDRAKAWILNQITSAVAAKIAEVVADAPEDLDTLKEIADWISAHADDAAAMNTQITENKNNIAALQTSVAGKADKEHTHSADDITSGTLPIANGGTGVTTQADINKAFIGNLDVGTSDVTDGTEFVSSWASDNGFAETEGGVNTPYKRKFSAVWGYIKGKISSVLGLTKDNYGGKAASAGTANYLSYQHANEINFKGGAQTQCWFNYRNEDTGGPSPVDTMEYRFCNYSVDTSKSVLIAGTAKTSSKLVIPIGAPSQLEDGCIWIER